MSYTPLTDARIKEISDSMPLNIYTLSRAIEAAATAPLLAEIDRLKAALAETDEMNEQLREQNTAVDQACANLESDNERLRAALAEASKDAQRLDWLDSLNAALNKHNGTAYGWKLVLSPYIVRLMAGQQANGFVGDVDLNDANAKGATSCRAAIDAMKGKP